MGEYPPQGQGAASVAFSAGVSILGNTSGTTGTVSRQLILAGGNNITLSENINGASATVTISAFNQSEQTQNLVDITISGNTAGIPSLVSSGTLTLAGGNNITLSQIGNAITISGGTIAVSAFSAGVSTEGNTSGTTGIVSNQIVYVGGNNITLSQSINANSATITISAFDQSIQTQSIIRDVNIIGNTSGTTADITSGTMYLAGGNSITLSQVGNSITISGASTSQSVQTQSIIRDVNIIGNTSGTTADITSGTLYLAGGNSITLSQVGNSITISGATTSQSVQTQSIIRDVNIIGNTSGTTADITSGTLYLAGGNNITLSQNGNSITISMQDQSQQTQNIIRDVNIGGNTSGTTADITSGTLSLIGGYAITLSQNANTITISGGEQVTAVVSDLGNTAGLTGAPAKMDQLIFVGGNNITLSQTFVGEDVTITIDAQSQSVQTQSIIRDVNIIGNTSGTTADITSGTLYLAGGNSITLSQNGNSITISMQDQSQQTQNIIREISLGGNTSGTLTDITSGTLSLIGGYAITLSQNANTITISGGEQITAVVSDLGNTAGLTGAPAKMDQLIFVGGNNITLSQTFVGEDVTITIDAQSQSIQTQSTHVHIISGNTSGTTASMSTGTILLAGGNSITLSQIGNSVTISGATTSQSVQTQNMVDVTISGNTSGTSTLVSSGTLTLIGGNNITLSQNGNAITISAGTAAGASFSAGVSTGGNTVGTIGTVDNQIIFVGGNNITLSQSINGQSATITISGASVAGASFSAGISTGGNTSGDTGTVQNQVVFAGGNNITLSGSINGVSATITVSAFNQSLQTQSIIRDVNIIGNTSGTTADITSGTLFLAGGNNITLSQNNNSITISAQSQSIETQSTHVHIISGNTTGTTASMSTGTIVLAGGNNITLSQNANTVTIIGTQTVQTQNLINVTLSGNTSGALALISSGTLTLAGGTNITLSQAGNAVTISGANQTFQGKMSNLGNTTGTSTGTVSNQLILVGGSNITLSQSVNAGSATLSIIAQSQSIQTQSIIRDVNIIGNTTGTTADITSGTLSLAGGNNITLSQAGGNAITIIAFNQTTQTQNLIDITLSGNTSGTLQLVSSGTLTLAGGNNITLNQAGNAVTISGGNSYSAGMSNLGNTSGTSGLVSQRLILVGGNNITLSQSTNAGSATLTISASNQTTQTQNLFDLTLSGNTSGTLQLVSSGTLTLAGGNNITLSQAGNAVTISAGNAPVPTLSYWGNADQTINTLATSDGRFWLFPLNPIHDIFPGNMTVSTALLEFSNSSNATPAFGYSWKIGIYTINGVSLSLLNSIVTSFGTTANNTAASSLFQGERFLTIHSSTWSAQPTFSQTQYFVGIIGNSTGENSPSFSIAGFRMLESGTIRSGTIGVGLTSGNTSMGVMPWIGVSGATRNLTAALPTNIQLSELVKTGALYGFIPYIQFNNISSNF